MKINRINDVCVLYDRSSQEVYCVAESSQVAEQIILEDFEEEARGQIDIVPCQYWGKVNK